MQHRTSTRTAAGAVARLGATGLTLSAAVLVPMPAHAVTPTTSGDAENPVVVVMDYSGSMAEADADAAGTTRVDAAKAAAKDLVDAVPDGAPLGLVAYGHRTPEDCGDIETLQEVGPADKDELKDRIDGLQALGETPIGAALEQAADALEGTAGKASIVLVSDGQPSWTPSSPTASPPTRSPWRRTTPCASA